MGGSGALCGAMEDFSTFGHVIENPRAISRSVALARSVARARLLASLHNWMESTRPDDSQLEPTELSRFDGATGINALTWSAPPPARRGCVGAARYGGLGGVPPRQPG